MKIATFNANSIRSRIEPIRRWLNAHQPDVLAVQETKVQDEDFPVDAFAETGYQVVFHGQKKYNGVALFSRIEPKNIRKPLPGDSSGQARFLQADYGPVTVVNTYAPQGFEVGTDKFEYKLKWFDLLRRYLKTEIQKKPNLIWLGDFNAAREDIDVYDPQGLWGSVCFCKEVQDALESVLSLGLVDLFRLHHPNQPGCYTFWDYRIPNSFKRNLGWRLDYITAAEPLARRCIRCEIDTEARAWDKPSDHTFLWAEFEQC